MLTYAGNWIWPGAPTAPTSFPSGPSSDMRSWKWDLSPPGGCSISISPNGATWRRLHYMGRLSTVRLHPPHGLLLVSIYAPLQIRSHAVAREKFVFLVFTHNLNMQTSTLLLGYFNGSADPQQEFLSNSGKRRPVCPLLSTLLGAGCAWVGTPGGYSALDLSGP
jgi:hypothetical protein